MIYCNLHQAQAPFVAMVILLLLLLTNTLSLSLTDGWFLEFQSVLGPEECFWETNEDFGP